MDVISESRRQRLLDCLRRKAKLDELSRLSRAREEGEAEGRREVRQKQILAGRIMTLQELLDIRPATATELVVYDEAYLNEIADQLLNQHRARGE